MMNRTDYGGGWWNEESWENEEAGAKDNEGSKSTNNIYTFYKLNGWTLLAE